MKHNQRTYTPIALTFISILPLLALIDCSGVDTSRKENPRVVQVLATNIEGFKVAMDIYFEKGKAHNHPTFAIWVEDMQENYIETLFVTRSLATGIWGYGEIAPGRWKPEPGHNVRPATLPYWLYKRGGGKMLLPTPQNPVTDAISGATPVGDFVLETRVPAGAPQKFRLLMEINQICDWNEYWTNDRYPDDPDYKSSSQPAVVYAVTIDPASGVSEYYMNPIGHSHYAGKDGKLYTDLTTLTTALQIANNIVVKVKQ